MKHYLSILVLGVLTLTSACTPKATSYRTNPPSSSYEELSTELKNYILTEVLKPLPDLDYDPAKDGIVDVIHLESADQSSYWSALTWMPTDQAPHREFMLSIYDRKQEQWVEITQLKFTGPSYVGLNPEMRQVDLDPTWYWLELSGLQGANIQTYQLITFDGQRLNVELTIEHDGAGARIP